MPPPIYPAQDHAPLPALGPLDGLPLQPAKQTETDRHQQKQTLIYNAPSVRSYPFHTAANPVPDVSCVAQ